MNKFIKLHEYSENKPIVVNVNLIKFIEFINTEIGVYSNMELIDNDETTHCINETPEKVYNLLKKEGCVEFLKLHNSDDNSVCIFNVNAIKYVGCYGNCGCISFNDNSDMEYTVNETPNRIFDMIQKIKKENKE